MELKKTYKCAILLPVLSVLIVRRCEEKELTIVSVTKGIGIAPVGGRAGVALLVGGNGGIDEKARSPLMELVGDLGARRTRRGNRCDIVVCL